MAAVCRSLERVDSPGFYLRRVVINKARSCQRGEHRQHERSHLLARERPTTLSALDIALFEAIGPLPYRQRVVIVARYWGGWSESEIAMALWCRRGTVKSLASRALHRLRSQEE